ncbi:MAG TPA: hypothetical protein VLY03_04790 [Bacteroidota bacterium]|nr:hypothetical protein [Bacteroidota bacterium]
MLRLALWLVLLFIVWKIVRISMNIGRSRREEEHEAPPFINIEEAEYEDLTKETPDESSEVPPEADSPDKPAQ